MRSFPILLALAVSNVVHSAPVDRKSFTRPASSSQPRVGVQLPTKARQLRRALLRVCANALDPNGKCDEDEPLYSRSFVTAQLGAFEPRAIKVAATVLGGQDPSDDPSAIGESSGGQRTSSLLDHEPLADVTAKLLDGGRSSSAASSSSSSSGDGSFSGGPVFAGHFPSSAGGHRHGDPDHGWSGSDNSQPARPRPDPSRPHSSSSDASQPDCDDGDQSYNPNNGPVLAGHVNHAEPSHQHIGSTSSHPPKPASKPRPLSHKLEPSTPAPDCGCTQH